jgi:hypothetical protein
MKRKNSVMMCAWKKLCYYQINRNYSRKKYAVASRHACHRQQSGRAGKRQSKDFCFVNPPGAGGDLLDPGQSLVSSQHKDDPRRRGDQRPDQGQ